MPRTGRPIKSFLHEDPFELVKRIPVGSKLRQKDDGYWFARTPFAPGVKSRKVYVGSDANKAFVERAWAIVGAELAELEATPEGRKLRALEAIAGGPPLARTIGGVRISLDSGTRITRVTLPQQELPFAAGERAGRRRPKR